MSYAHYFALERSIKELGFDFERNELIEQFTEGKNSSLKELSPQEYNHFTEWLHTTFIKSAINKPQSAITNKFDPKNPLNIMRRKLLALFYKMGYQNEGKTDVKAVDTWCRKYGQFHKGLNEMNGSELPAVITQAEKMYKTYLEGV